MQVASRGKKGKFSFFFHPSCFCFFVLLPFRFCFFVLLPLDDARSRVGGGGTGGVGAGGGRIWGYTKTSKSIAFQTVVRLAPWPPDLGA